MWLFGRGILDNMCGRKGAMENEKERRRDCDVIAAVSELRFGISVRV